MPMEGALPGRASTQPLRGDTLLAWRRQQLSRGGRPVDFDWLLDLAGGVSWGSLQDLRLHPDHPVSLRCPPEAIEDLWQCHLQEHVPLQYLVGRCPWRDLELQVAPGVLIPRQDTEQLPDLAVSLCRDQGVEPRLWADLGTGSGCLAVALALAFPQAGGVAVDSSPVCLAQAEANLRAQGVLSRVRLVPSDWWQAMAFCRGRLDLVVANPPYIPSSTVDQLDPVVRCHEPRLALDGGADGLEALRRVVAGAPQALAPGGLLVLEHHHDQSDAVLALLAAAGLAAVRWHPDLQGVRRFASACRPTATMVEADSPPA